MTKQFINTTAKTIFEQLTKLTPQSHLLSWGIRDGVFMAETFHGMASLQFVVNARLFQGRVIIAYNEADYYEIYLKDKNGTRTLCQECYFNELGQVIDEAIESGTDPEEYRRFCEGVKNQFFKL